ncbi:doxx family protein [Sabulilitoribacter arenilitoris]|uniref:Doxx family protein n=1 Tax=Wocania arenilitoris TaxID=2044858 RepID=A0AAE3ENS9_9FLAO|nr:doxx family protein [Wocania arenilitoris]MCF7568843.1 doxx family protein [Wocania arenilitoris]
MNELKNVLVSKIYKYSDKHKVSFLAISIGLIYLWFGILKLFPGLSPAENLAGNTLSAIVFYTINQRTLLIVLALVEIFIGINLLFQKRNKLLIYLVFIHMIGTLLPLFIFPEISFTKPPFGFSIIGQYIMKNFVIISGLIIVFSKKSTK